MPIALPSLSVCFLGMLFVPSPVILHLFAALAVVGAAALVVAVARAERPGTEPPRIVTRRPRALVLSEAA
jgi:hypothetical protein